MAVVEVKIVIAPFCVAFSSTRFSRIFNLSTNIWESQC
nr:MAG TPA: hypothetical protein [Bacteriophage sp.]